MASRFILSITTAAQPSTPLSEDRIVALVDNYPGYIERKRYVYRWASKQQHDLNQMTMYRGTRMPLPSEIKFFRNADGKLVAIFEEGHEIEPPMLDDCQLPFATVITIRQDLPLAAPESTLAPASQRPVSHVSFSEPFAFREAPSTLQPPRQSQTQRQSTPLTQKRPYVSNISGNWDHPPTFEEYTSSTFGDNWGAPAGSRKRSRGSDEDDQGDAVKRVKQFITSPTTAFVVGVAFGSFYPSIVSQVCHSISP